jgi:hypothetical protein
MTKLNKYIICADHPEAWDKNSNLFQWIEGDDYNLLS